MTKQTFVTGQVLTASQMTALQQTAMLGGAASAQTASYVLVAANAGDAITMNNAGATTITVNAALFSAGDIVTIINLGAGVTTITAGTATVTTSGSLALAQNQGGVLRFTTASAAIFFQFATPASGDIEGVTAGVGISGGGTSGTVTVTNSMATAIDAKGDLVPGTGADTFARLAVGSNDTVLTADSTTATGLKWATPSSGGMTLISTTTLSGTSTTISSIPNTYNDLQVVFRNAITGNTQNFFVRFNGDTASNYIVTGSNSGSGPSLSTEYAWNQNGNPETGSTPMTAIMNVFDYANTSAGAGKFVQTFYTVKNGATSFALGNLIGAYRSTSAISSLTIASIGGTTISGTALLYGVK